MKLIFGIRALPKLLLFSLGVSTIFIFAKLVSISEPYQISNRLGPAWQLLQGRIHPDSIQELSEDTDEDKMQLMSSLRLALGNLFMECTNTRNDCLTANKSENKLLTLFTTWVYERDKIPINNRTLFNWRTLPDVNLVVFTNSIEVKYYSGLAGFEALPVGVEASGAPVLPAMFTAVMQKYKSDFYGFANGDILFTNSLMDTLHTIKCHLNQTMREKGLLIVGRRVNIPASLVTDETSTSWARLAELAARSGQLFQTDAEDYFITDSVFPWKQFLPVAIGRRAYDNWVVAFSRYQNITVIDASESVLCLHQTLESRGNYEGLAKGRYNIDLINKLNLPFSFTGWGRTSCSGLKTWIDLCGNTVISQRIKLNSECTKFYWSHNLYKMLGILT